MVLLFTSANSCVRAATEMLQAGCQSLGSQASEIVARAAMRLTLAAPSPGHRPMAGSHND